MEMMPRETFVSERDRIMSKLNELLEKTIQIENELRIKTDKCANTVEPPKKKMRKE